MKMNGTGEHIGKQNKLDYEKQISHSFLYVELDLKNKGISVNLGLFVSQRISRSVERERKGSGEGDYN
jgi:hypothetical protein